MKKIIYMSLDFGNQVFSAPKECMQELEELFKGFKYPVKIEAINDDNVKIDKDILRKDTLLRDFWYAVLTQLKESGYNFSSYVQRKYDWYESEHIKLEEERRILAEKIKEHEEKQRKKEEQRKQEESQYAWLCVKYGSITTLEYCRRCRYNTKYNLGCRAQKIKIKQGE